MYCDKAEREVGDGDEGEDSDVGVLLEALEALFDVGDGGDL